MLIRHHKFFTAPVKTFNSQTLFWLSLSLTFAAIYGLLGLREAFSSAYVIQDDARQHVFWMERFIDPELFPNDLIADYFQSVAPLGYSTFYRVFAAIGIDPIFLSKVIPIILGLITTVYCFGITLQLLPVPLAGFLASLLLNQYLWLRDDIVSATAVAFVYPLFMAFLYYFVRRSLVPCLVSIALIGLFYPQCVFVAAGTLLLQLWQWNGKLPRLSRDRQDYWFCGAGLGVAALVMSLYAFKSSAYGPVLTLAEAKTMMEFGKTGLSKFFSDIPQHFWFTGQRSGMVPRLGTVAPIILAVLLPPLLPFPSQFPLLRQVNQQVTVLVRVILASVGMFFVSHALLFKLHLPSRYTEHSLRVVTAIAGGIALTILLDALLQWATQRRQSTPARTLGGRQALALGVITLLLTVLIAYPAFLRRFPKTDYYIGQVPALYEFFAQQPKDILIASLSSEVTNLPSFAKRSILVGGAGYPVPYHKGYYRQIRERTIDLIKAQYSPDLEQVQQLIQKYGIDFWLLEPSSFQPSYITRSRWIRQYQPAAGEAVTQLTQGTTPALVDVMEKCLVFQSGGYVVLKASCITDLPPQ